jgi:hypothetical protein
MPNWNSRAPSRARSKLASIVQQCPTGTVGLGQGLNSEHWIQRQHLKNQMNKMNADAYQKPTVAVQEQMVYLCGIMEARDNE